MINEFAKLDVAGCEAPATSRERTDITAAANALAADGHPVEPDDLATIAHVPAPR